MQKDHKVPFQTYEMVQSIAQKARDWHISSDSYKFDVVGLVRQLVGKPLGKIGIFRLKIFNGTKNSIPFASFNPPTINFPKKLWREAELGKSMAIFMLSHELGHILLHNFYPQNFSVGSINKVAYAIDEESAEVQANWFAGCLLAPDSEVQKCKSIKELCDIFNYPMEFAKDRFPTLPLRTPNYDGEVCPECGNFNMVRNGTCLNCATCGQQSSCA